MYYGLWNTEQSVAWNSSRGIKPQQIPKFNHLTIQYYSVLGFTFTIWLRLFWTKASFHTKICSLPMMIFLLFGKSVHPIHISRQDPAFRFPFKLLALILKYYNIFLENFCSIFKYTSKKSSQAQRKDIGINTSIFNSYTLHYFRSFDGMNEKVKGRKLPK